MSTTVVTALYDIGRGKMKDRRSYEVYLRWFATLLQIDCPMVIFVEPQDAKFVKMYRNTENTVIIERPYTELYAYRYRQAIQTAQDDMRKKYRHGYLNFNPEFTSPDYCVVITSKFDFLVEASRDNHFNSEYFIWLDAGTYRHELPFSGPWPDPDKMAILGDRFLISDYHFTEYFYKNKYDYLITNQSRINAHILGGKAAIVKKVRDDIYQLLEDVLSRQIINNEQLLLQLLIIDNPQDYYIWPYKKYPDYPLPTNERMVAYELARDTYLSQDYPYEDKLQVLCDQDNSYSRYLAKKYGYRLVKNIDPNVPYTMVLSHPSLFTASATSVLRKLSQFDSTIVAIKNNDQFSFLLGPTSDIMELTETLKGGQEILLELSGITLDHQGQFAVQCCDIEELHFEPKLRRYRYRDYAGCPDIILCCDDTINSRILESCYQQLTFEAPDTETETESNWWWIILIILIIFLLMIFAIVYYF